jgi:hypothetical protein
LETSATSAKIAVAARGRVAQLGERLVRNEEVAGSIPVSSTKLFNNLDSLLKHDEWGAWGNCMGRKLEPHSDLDVTGLN